MHFFDVVLPPLSRDGNYVLAIKSGGFIHHYAGDMDFIKKFAVSHSYQDVWFSLAEFKYNVINGKPKRKAEYAYNYYSLGFDIDAGDSKDYPDMDSALQAATSALNQIGITEFTSICSGNGVHVYIPLTEVVSKDEWIALSSELGSALTTLGLAYDRSKIKEPAMLLRVPDTKNTKNQDNHLPVYTINLSEKRYDPSTLTEMFEPHLGDINSSVNCHTHVNKGEWRSDNQNIDHKMIEAECYQLRSLVTNANVPEPQWYLALGVAAACSNPPEVAIRWSQAYDKFNERTTLNKMAQWVSKTTGPATCAQFRDQNPAGCAGCKHTGKITTPAQLGFTMLDVDYSNDVSLADIGIEEQSTPAPPPKPEKPEWHEYIPRPYGVDKAGMIWLQTEDKPELVSDRPLYICDASIYTHRTSPEIVLTICIHDRKDIPRYIDVPIGIFFGTVKGGDSLPQKLGNMGLVITTPTQTKLVQTYLARAAQNYLDYSKTGKIVSSMGWDEDGFIWGSKQFCLDLRQEDVKPKDRNNKIFESCTTKGSLESWVKMTEVFKHPSFSYHAFAFFCGFGAPLLKFMNCSGAVVNLYCGDSGTGKSTIGGCIMSQYGNKDRLTFSAEDTVAAVFSKLGVLKNVPAYIDEVSMWSGEAISQFLYFSTGGKEKDRLDREANLKEGTTWNTLIITTSNVSFEERLLEWSRSIEGQKQRYFEIPIKMTPVIAKYGDKINNCTTKNYGHVAEVYLPHIVHLYNTGKLTEIIDQSYGSYEHEFNFSFIGQERFVESTILAAWIGSTIAKSIGLIHETVDINKIFRDINDLVVIRRRSYLENKIAPMDILNNFLARNIAAFVKVKGFKLTKKYVGTCPGGPLMGRLEFTYSDHITTNPPVSGKLTVSYAEIQRYCKDNNYPFGELLSGLQDDDNLKMVRHKVFLAAGLKETIFKEDVPNVSVDCITVNVPQYLLDSYELKEGGDLDW